MLIRNCSMYKYKFFAILFLTCLIIPSAVITAQTSACTAQVAGKTRVQLEAELEACNREIAEWTSELNKVKQDSASFSRDISVLTAKINAAQANINSRNIAINKLSRDITTKEKEITALDSRVSRILRSVADILRKTNELGNYSVAEAILSTKQFSEFFADVDSYSSTEVALSSLLDELRQTRTLTEAEKLALAKKRQAEADARAAIEAAKKQVEVDQKEKKTLLALNQTKEKTYEQVIAEKQAKAAQIRATLFPLRDSGPIQFGTALQYAEQASKVTGVRPALILGILQQESALGANVGSCIITNLSTGETKSVTSGKIFANGIHPSRDLPLLQTIVKGLGRDPLTTRVSCPLSIGYGGAMGPAQFIPSTWNLLQAKVATALGKPMADPWSPADAIMASAMLLRDLGAATGTYEAERNAACRYYSGRTCASFAAAATYGNQVMAKATNIQNNMINLLAVN
jgi:membrane-bound lytic murein transglycosylase B